MGVAIGPATSNIFAECILKEIDDKLSESGYVFSRFIDDYTAYCHSNEESEKFISDLSEELRKYKLTLNLKKTYIRELPTPSGADWISDLSTRLPKTKKINYFDAIKFIDYAVHIQNKTPDGSILKYALKTISKRAEVRARLSVAKYALSLAYKNPIVIPLLDPLILRLNKVTDFDLEGKLLSILEDNIINKRSDGICWCVFLINKFCGNKIPDHIANSILKTKDCLSITALYATGNHDPKIISFANEIIAGDLFDIDCQWILLYQLFYDKKISNPYENDRLYSDVKANKETNNDAMKREVACFNILRMEKVTFVDASAMSHSKINTFKAHLLKLVYSNIRKKVAA